MALSPSELFDGFITYGAENEEDDLALSEPPMRRRVSFGLRCPSGPGGGYVRVWGPSADPRRPGDSHVIIERYNGVVGVRAPLHVHIPGALPRTDVSIQRDPLGFGCGGNYGPFTHAIPPTAMGPGNLYADATAVVTAVLRAFGEAGMLW